MKTLTHGFLSHIFGQKRQVDNKKQNFLPPDCLIWWQFYAAPCLMRQPLEFKLWIVTRLAAFLPKTPPATLPPKSHPEHLRLFGPLLGLIQRVLIRQEQGRHQQEQHQRINRSDFNRNIFNRSVFNTNGFINTSGFNGGFFLRILLILLTIVFNPPMG